MDFRRFYIDKYNIIFLFPPNFTQNSIYGLIFFVNERAENHEDGEVENFTLGLLLPVDQGVVSETLQPCRQARMH